ncbi:MAG TPA: hypothetical protein VGK87_07690 [Anaerolineae bacterium]|jgi:hypothetical protein
MSKKPRRQRRPNLPPEAFSQPAASPAVQTATASANGTSAATARQATDINWQEEYSEVLGDLKRTAVLAVIMVAAMGVLSFIIR